MPAKTILDLLDKWPLWKRITETPSRLDALEKRVADLEQKLGDKWPPDVCKHCGERAARMMHSARNPKWSVTQKWQCASCGNAEIRVV